MNFRNWLENKIFQGITPEDINWLSNYARSRKFSTEQEARNWIFNRRQRSDAEHGAAVGVDGPEYNRAFADNFPIYQSGKSFKIGKRIRNNENRFRLRDLEIKIPDWEYIVQTAQANGTEDFKVCELPRR